jgi:transposase-like protein
MSILESDIVEEFDITFFQDGMYQEQYDYLNNRREEWREFVERRMGKISDAAFQHEADSFYNATTAELDGISTHCRKVKIDFQL